MNKQRLIDIGPDEMWTDFLEEINELMIEEKAARQVSDHIKLAEICTRIVSFLTCALLTNFHFVIDSNILRQE